MGLVFSGLEGILYYVCKSHGGLIYFAICSEGSCFPMKYFLIEQKAYSNSAIKPYFTSIICMVRLRSLGHVVVT